MCIRDRERSEQAQSGEDYCKWCDNTKYFYVLMGIVGPDELPEGFIFDPVKHKNMRKMYRNHDEYLVRPEAARKKGVFMQERSLWCDRCQEADHERGRSPIAALRSFVANFEGFFEYRGEERRIGRVLDDFPPRIKKNNNFTEVNKEIFDVSS